MSPPSASALTSVGRLARALLAVAPDQPWLAALSRTEDALLPPGQLERVVETWGLSAFETDALLLVLSPDLDDRFAALFAQLCGGPRPTLGLLLRALVPQDQQRWQVQGERVYDTLLMERLIRATDADLPLAARPMRASPVLLAVLGGRLPPRMEGLGLVELYPAEDAALALETRPALREAATALADIVRGAAPTLLHLPSRDRGAGRLLAAATAQVLGLPALLVAEPPTDAGDLLADLSILACLAGVVPVLDWTEARPLASQRPWTAPLPLVVITGEDGAVRQPVAGGHTRTFAPPATRPPDQAALWRALLDAVGGEAPVDLLANQTRLEPAQVRRAVGLAANRAATQGRAGPNPTDVSLGLAEVARPPSSPLARASRPAVPWTSLVLPPDALGRLEELRDRVRFRLAVHHGWGMASATGRGDGVVALLHGESGTGKTFSAEALATALALPLVAVDLSRVVSKYIGETEKHLAEVFDAAEGFQALLFFDEADALFGKRTAVRDAHDRYANIETNYLLQRLEAFEGVAVLSTNLYQNLDDAFLRRIPFVIPLPRPTAHLQRRLWALQLPAAACAPGLDPGAVAARYDLVGGEIRGAALTAAFSAAAAGQLVQPAHVLEAARRELVKKGRPIPVN